MPDTNHSQKMPDLSRTDLIALNRNLAIPRALVCELARVAQAPNGSTESEDPLASANSRVRRQVQATVDRSGEFASEELAGCKELGIDIITLYDSHYPTALRDLALPPPVLYLRGSIPSRPCLSIVGARKASSYGRDVATAFASTLAGQHLTIVSGLARGVDTCAHEAAVAAEGGTTLAILGCGLDIDYPRGSRRLRDQISQQGAVLTEFPLGTSPLPFNFPIRNRLIAALGFATLVVEATARSGSLITARLALELGRDIFATPGRIFDPKGAGPNTLIRDGAFLVQHPSEILETLPTNLYQQLRIAEEEAKPTLSGRLATLPRRVLEAIEPGTRISVDSLGSSLDLRQDELLGILLELELAGWIRRYPGPTYGRTEFW